MTQTITRSQVLEFLRNLPVEFTPEGKRVIIGNSALASSPIADCDLNELMEHLYELEKQGYISLAQHYPSPFDEHTGLITNFIYIHDDLLPVD